MCLNQGCFSAAAHSEQHDLFNAKLNEFEFAAMEDFENLVEAAIKAEKHFQRKNLLQFYYDQYKIYAEKLSKATDIRSSEGGKIAAQFDLYRRQLVVMLAKEESGLCHRAVDSFEVVKCQQRYMQQMTSCLKTFFNLESR